MKKIYSAVMLSAIAVSGLNVSAEKPNWEHPGSWQLFEQANQFRIVCGTRPLVADFNNDDRFDIYYGGGGEYYEEYNKPGMWGWPFMSLLYLDNGDGTYKCLFNEPEYVETRQEERQKTDEEGNPVVDQDGKPVMEIVDVDYYKQGFPKNGIIPGFRQNYALFDYNNDGLQDIYMVMVVDSNDYNASYRDQLYFEQVVKDGEGKNCYITCQLYRNNGDGTFARIDGHGLPLVRPDANSDEARRLYNNVFAVGDYDRDGYVDIAVCGKRVNRASGEPYRIAQLYRNIDGTGHFEQMNIAETKGGSYAEAQLGEPEIELPGWFLPISGNVKFADLNNDGWLDLLFTGYAPGESIHDPSYPAGQNNVSRVYINQDNGQGGRKFVDVTDVANFMAPRSGAVDLSPNKNTGYFDLYAGGYLDNTGWVLQVFNNNLPDGGESVYSEGINLNLEGFDVAWKEDYRPLMRDFNADGEIDIYFDRADNNNIYYGDPGGNFAKECNYLNIRDFAEDTGVSPADFNGDGRTDLFMTGYCYAEGQEYQYIRNIGWGGGYGALAVMYENQNEYAPEDIAVPTDVHAKIENGMLTVTWLDNEDLTCAYNVYIETPDRGIITLVPANPLTGFVRNNTDRHVAVRPGVQSYSIPVNYEKGYKVGVQALSLFNEKYTPFVWSEEDLSSVGLIESETTNVEIKVDGNNVTVNADANADVKIVDMLGRTVATGVTNAPINVAHTGVMIATVNGKSVKFVKK